MNRFGGEREAQEFTAGWGAPLLYAEQAGQRDIPAGFLQRFADRGRVQRLAGFEVPGGLVEHDFAAYVLLDDQEAPVARHHGRDSHVRAPDAGVVEFGGRLESVWSVGHRVSLPARPEGLAVRHFGSMSRHGFLQPGVILNPAVTDIRLMAQLPEQHTEHTHGLAVEEARPEVVRPPLYQVVLLNDDFTPMDFVIAVLETFFSMDRERATQVMLHVHTRGKGVCGVFTREVAETKVTHVNEFSRVHQHPLLCTMEKA